MSLFSVIRGGLVGVLAVAVPAVAMGVAEVFIIRGLGAFLGMLCVALVLVGLLAWAGMRVAHFPPGLAMFFTTVSFGILVLMTLRSLVNGSPVPFLLCLVQLLVAVFVAWVATRLARR